MANMKKSPFTETQILTILKQQEAGLSLKEICRKYGISEITFNNWKILYGAMKITDVNRIKEFEKKNSLLKRNYSHR
jgi:putative transposase